MKLYHYWYKNMVRIAVFIGTTSALFPSKAKFGIK